MHFRSLKIGISRFALAVLATHTTACTYATPKVSVPQTLPAISATTLDHATITVGENGAYARPDVTDAVKHELRDELAGATHAADAKSTDDTRVSIHVTLIGNDDFIADAGYADGCGAVPFALAAPAGAKIENEKVMVDVALENDGRTYRGHGFGDKDGSLYAGARKRALAVALNAAMANAAQSAPIYARKIGLL